MKKRSRTGGEQIKGRRPKTPEPKRRNAPEAVGRSKSAPAQKDTEVARLTRELSEARERQTATSDVLQVISSFAKNELVGVIGIYRQEIRPFTDKQIDLVKNFAAQAVIAIENARLLNELRQRTTDLTKRTADLTEALKQQTATSEVLQVISSSPGDLEPVFTNMLVKAVRICNATFGELYRWDGETFQLASMHNTPPRFVEERKRAQFIRPRLDGITGRMLTAKRTAQITDLAADPLYADERYPSYVAAVELATCEL